MICLIDTPKNMEECDMGHMILLGHLQALPQMSTTGSAEPSNGQNLSIRMANDFEKGS